VNAEVISMLRQRRVLIAAAVALLVILIWMVALFLPEGRNVGTINVKVQAAQNEQVQLQDRLARLKSYSRESAKFEALQAKLTASVPSTTDIYDYITAISQIATATGIKVSNVDPQPAQASGNVSVIPVAISASGTYDQTLAFIKALYALPRLTLISNVSISGGGNNTNRGTVLNDQFSLEILAQPAAAHAGTP